MNTKIIYTVLWMIGALFSLIAMTIGAKELSGSIGIFETIFFRCLVGVAILSLISLGLRQPIKPFERYHLHVLRNVSHLGGQYLWFYAIALIPLVNVYALEFTTPIWVVLFATLLLGEAISVPRILAIALGFAGILIILKPSMLDNSIGTYAALMSALLYAVSMITTKVLSPTHSGLSILWGMCLIQLPISLFFAISDWTWPSGFQYIWLAMIGISGLTAHYCIIKAFKYSDASIVVPMDFLRLPLIAVLGLILYQEQIDGYIFIGALLMFIGNYLNVFYEQRKAR